MSIDSHGFQNDLMNDISARSLSVLIPQVKSLLLTKFSIQKPWFPDTYEYPTEIPALQDVVLTGDFLRRLLESGNWIFPEMRFWCLGSPAHCFLTRMLGFAENEISTIDRYELFPLAETSPKPPLHSSSRPCNFVYAGKLTPYKKILTLIWTAFYLQKKHRFPVQLHLFGSFLREDLFHFQNSDNPYENEVRQLIADLPWNQPPLLHGQVSPEEWQRFQPGTAIAISYSILPFEDFGLSLTEAQLKSWPLICNGWGGYNDLRGQVLKIPYLWVGSNTETPNEARYSGEAAADFIFKFPISWQNIEVTPATLPLTVSKKSLDRKREALLENWGMALAGLPQRKISALKGHAKIEKFMDEYRKCFLGKPGRNGTKVAPLNCESQSPDPLAAPEL